MWDFVEGRAVNTKADERAAAIALRTVHSALADVDAELPSFIVKIESCEIILANPNEAPSLEPGDRRFLTKLYETLSGRLSAITGVWQPLHGDAHLGNVRISRTGAIWMDLEAVCRGPVEWDVASLPPASWRHFPDLDQAVMRLLTDVRSLCVAIWCWAEFDRSAATREAAINHLGTLKDRFA